MVAQQVPGQRAHARPVVPVHVRGGRGGVPGQGDDRQLPGQTVHLVRLEHAVVQDQAVALAGQRQRPAARVVLGDADRPDQQVESAALSGHLDTPVDQVGVLQAIGHVREHVLVHIRRPRPAHDHADDLLEPRAQRPCRPVRREPELGHGRQHSLPRVLPRVPLPVEHPGHRRDGHPGRPRHVIDRRCPRRVRVLVRATGKLRPRQVRVLVRGHVRSSPAVSAYRNRPKNGAADDGTLSTSPNQLQPDAVSAYRSGMPAEYVYRAI